MDLLLLSLMISSSEAFIFSPIWLSNDDAHGIDQRSKVAQVCDTSDCTNAAAELLSNMNQSVDPCVDFYQFACGGWSKANPIPATESSWGQFDVAGDKNYQKIKGILEDNINLDEPTPVTAMKVVYQSCMKKDLNDTKENVRPLLDRLQKMGNGWPMILGSQWSSDGFVWYELAADIISNFYSASLLGVFVTNDRRNTSTYIITIDQPSFALKREMLLKPSSYKKHVEAYKVYLIGVAWVFAKSVGNSDLTKKSLIKEAEELLAFEMKLAELTSPEEMRRNVIRTYNAMTLHDLQDWSDAGAVNQIDWLAFFKRLTSPFNYTIDWSERVIIRETDFIFKLMKLLHSTPARVVANFMHWSVVRQVSRDLTMSLRKQTFDFEKVVTGATSEQPVWKECIEVVDATLNMALGYSYVQKHFDNAAKLAALQMTDNIKSVFSEQLQSMDWMDDATKAKALHKITAMSSHIGYPSWFSNLTAFESYYEGLEVFPDSHFKNVISALKFKFFKNFSKLRKPFDRNEWVTSPAEVNAFFSPLQNTVRGATFFVHNECWAQLEKGRASDKPCDFEFFPAAMLQPPFFTKGRLEALNYGGIGVIIGHEITHAFDDVGRQFDAEGNMAPWWSEKTTETYLNKSRCFISQYNKYVVPELVGTPETKVNGAVSLGENIADNGGLRSALAAYRKYTAKYGPEPRLPGLEKYSAEQLFFIASATNWCEISTKEALLDMVLSDPHTPNRFRVLGTVQNSEDFSRAFRCPKIKTNRRCIMW